MHEDDHILRGAFKDLAPTIGENGCGIPCSRRWPRNAVSTGADWRLQVWPS